jgi:uncharacterized protein (TIGR02001 family)
MSLVNRLAGACLAATLLVGASGVAHAEDAAPADKPAMPFTVTGSVTFASDYNLRGISQTDRAPALQGGLTFTVDPGFFASVWASNVDFNDGGNASLELDYLVGYTGTVDALSYTGQVIFYTYPGSPGSLNYAYIEGNIGLAYDTGFVIPNVNVYYSPDTFGGVGKAWYFTGGLKSEKLADMFQLYVNVGKYSYKRVGIKDAVDWNAGIIASVYGIDLNLQYAHNDDKSYGKWSKGRVIISATKAF